MPGGVPREHMFSVEHEDNMHVADQGPASGCSIFKTSRLLLDYFFIAMRAPILMLFAASETGLAAKRSMRSGCVSKAAMVQLVGSCFHPETGSHDKIWT